MSKTTDGKTQTKTLHPIRDVALAVGVHPDALRGKVDRGTVPYTLVEGRRHVDPDDVLVSYGVTNEERARRYPEILRALDSDVDLRGPVASSDPIDPFGVGHDEEEITSEEAPLVREDISQSAEELMQNRGLDPEDWVVDTASATEWQGPVAGGGVRAFQRIQVGVKRRRPEYSLVPARSDGWIAPNRTGRKATWDNPQLVVIVGDQQAPFHNPILHELFCAWLDENRPDRGVLNGDLVDYPDVSRHRKTPERYAVVNECNQAGYDIARGYVEASPNTEWEYIPGNHDERIRNFTLDWAPELYDLKRATPWEGEEERSVHAVEFLLRLDELGIRFVDPDGSYARAFVKLSPYLAVRHGWIAAKGAGTSALKTLEHLGYSVIVNHTHRQAIVHMTKHDIDQRPKTLQAVEGGCMCIIDDKPVVYKNDIALGANYTPAPDWQNGFTTATIWPDGTFKVDSATYFDGTLLWHGQRYT